MKKSLVALACLLSFSVTAQAESTYVRHPMLTQQSIQSKHSLDLSKLLKSHYAFGLRDTHTGRMIYSEHGQMNFLKNGGIGQADMPLQAYAFPTDPNDTTCKLIDLVFPTTLAPQATHELRLSMNLDSRSAIPTGNFNPDDSTTYNRVINIKIIDSLGKSHDFLLYFVKKSPNDWSTYISIDTQLIAHGAISFDQSGNLANADDLAAITFYPKNGAAAQTLSITPTQLTAYATDTAERRFTQDGSETGYLVSFEIDTVGDVNLTYDNDITVPFAKIATFPATTR